MRTLLDTVYSLQYHKKITTTSKPKYPTTSALFYWEPRLCKNITVLLCKAF